MRKKESTLTLAASTTTSSTSPDGNSRPRSEQAAVAPSIPTDNAFSSDSAKALLSIILGMASEMLDENARVLALIRARKNAAAMGCDLREFDRIVSLTEKHMEVARRRNPLSCMF